MDLNSFHVRVFQSNELIYQNGPRRISAAVEIYLNCLRKYLRGFSVNEEREGFSGNFNLRVYSDKWIEDNYKMWTRQDKMDEPAAKNMIIDIGQRHRKGHVTIEFLHSSKVLENV